VNYFDKAQRVLKAVNRLLGTAQQLFDAAHELRKRQADESLPFEERYRATILIEEAIELAKDHLDLVDRLIRRTFPQVSSALRSPALRRRWLRDEFGASNTQVSRPPVTSGCSSFSGSLN
jgi:hypothetical protein